MNCVAIQERDRELLVGLWRFGVLLRDHVQALYFPGCALRRVNRRLERLGAADMIEGSPVTVGSVWLGLPAAACSGQYGYRLSIAGVKVVAEALGRNREDVRRRIRYSPSYVTHAVGVASVAIALKTFAATQGYTLGEVLCESETWHSYQWRTPGGPWQSEIIRPDATAALTLGARRVQLFIEADMASQGRCAFVEKLHGYERYLRTGACQRRYPGAEVVLAVVTTSEARSKILRQLLEEVGIEFGLVTTFDALTRLGPLSPIWEGGTHTRKELFP